jgi:hypothetical protein
VINYTYAEITLAGYRKEEFGLLAHYNGYPVGIIELAAPSAHLKAFYGIKNRKHPRKTGLPDEIPEASFVYTYLLIYTASSVTSRSGRRHAIELT